MKKQALQRLCQRASLIFHLKTIDFYTSCINEEKVMDGILETLLANNDELYVFLHEPGTNAFTLNEKMKRKQKILQSQN